MGNPARTPACFASSCLSSFKRIEQVLVCGLRSHAVQTALEGLHSQRIAYRGLCPTTIVLTTSGHAVLCDLSFAKKLSDRTFTVCGPPEFWAPEMVQLIGHTEAVDWWALGCLLFCLLAQTSPFHSSGAPMSLSLLLAAIAVSSD